MYRPPYSDNDNGSLPFSIRNSPEWPSVGLPSPRPSVPTLNEPDEEQHRDDTISSLANVSYQESSYNGSVRTARVSKSSFDNRSLASTPTRRSFGQVMQPRGVERVHSHSHSPSRGIAYPAQSHVHPRPSQRHSATSVHAAHAGAYTPLPYTAPTSTAPPNTTTGAVVMDDWDYSRPGQYYSAPSLHHSTVSANTTGAVVMDDWDYSRPGQHRSDYGPSLHHSTVSANTTGAVVMGDWDYSRPGQYSGAPSLDLPLHSQPPQTTDVWQAGVFTEIHSAASDPGTNVVITGTSYDHWDRMARTEKWLRSLDINSFDNKGAWSRSPPPVEFKNVSNGDQDNGADGEQPAIAGTGRLAENERSLPLSQGRIPGWWQGVLDAKADETFEIRSGDRDDREYHPPLVIEPDTEPGLYMIAPQRTGDSFSPVVIHPDSDPGSYIVVPQHSRSSGDSFNPVVIHPPSQFGANYVTVPQQQPWAQTGGPVVISGPPPSYTKQQRAWARNGDTTNPVIISVPPQFGTNHQQARVRTGGTTSPVAVPPQSGAKYVPQQQTWAQREEQLSPERAGALRKPKWLESLADYVRARAKT